MIPTVFGGMDDKWAAHMGFEAQRIPINIYTKQGIKKLSKSRINLVVLFDDRDELETNTLEWGNGVKSLLPYFVGYEVVLVVQNEPSMQKNYTPLHYVNLIKVTIEAAPGYEVLHGGWLRNQVVRMYAEKVVKPQGKNAYNDFRDEMRKRDLWGKIEQVSNAMQELSLIATYGLKIGLNYHFQQAYDVLGKINDYMLTFGYELSGNEYGFRSNNPDEIRGMVNAVKGKVKYYIQDNMPGTNGKIVPLDEKGEEILRKAIAV